MASKFERIILMVGTMGILGMLGSPMINNKEVRDRVYEAGTVITIATIGYYSVMKENQGGSQ